MAERFALWQWMVAAIDEHQAPALLIVAESRGSSPGIAGAKMAITLNSAIGTIGGGMIEADLVKNARTLLQGGETIPKIVRRAHHHSKTVEPSGMICGGEQTVLIYPCHPADRAIFERLTSSCRDGVPSRLTISRQGIEVSEPSEFHSPSFLNGEDWRYLEIVGLYPRAYIIGAGHVGMALAKLLDLLDFDITMLDERKPNDETPECSYARRQWRISYSEIADYVPEGPNIFVFIMTDDHRCDELVAAKLAGKRYAYLGLLGSRHKVARIKNSLAREIPVEQLRCLHAPMGLAINSHTPWEIAMSIAAEVIQTYRSNSRV